MAHISLVLPKVSLVVAAYNEAPWLGETLSAALATGVPDEVIVVDDGSTDATAQVARAFGASVRLLRHAHNRGKGAALATGVRAAAGEIVVFCDAHLRGLQTHHLLALILPLVQGGARAVLGLDVPVGLSPALFRPLPLFMLTGQRAYWRQDLLPLCAEMAHLGYGVETFLFRRFPRERTALVLLPGLEHLSKRTTRSSWQATRGYLREMTEITNTLWRLALDAVRARERPREEDAA